MSNKKLVNPVFTFWVENKISNKREYFASDIRQQFQKWLVKQDIKWVKYYSCTDVVLSFITAREGLNSVHDKKDTENIINILRPDYINICNGINPVSKLPIPIK